jgi:hypothetical protein
MAMDARHTPSLAEMVDSLKDKASTKATSSFGWATVDVDRSIRDLALGDDAPWEDAHEPLLGAAGRRITFGTSTAVILEPSTEGLLAGWLAYNGEGSAVSYVDADADSGPRNHVVTGTGRTGWLERAGDLRFPFVIHVDDEGP